MSPMFLTVIADAAVQGAIGTVFLTLLGAIKVLYSDSKAAARYAREERAALADALTKNTDALKDLARNCPVGRA